MSVIVFNHKISQNIYQTFGKNLNLICLDNMIVLVLYILQWLKNGCNTFTVFYK